MDREASGADRGASRRGSWSLPARIVELAGADRGACRNGFGASRNGFGASGTGLEPPIADFEVRYLANEAFLSVPGHSMRSSGQFRPRWRSIMPFMKPSSSVPGPSLLVREAFFPILKLPERPFGPDLAESGVMWTSLSVLLTAPALLRTSIPRTWSTSTPPAGGRRAAGRTVVAASSPRDRVRRAPATDAPPRHRSRSTREAA